MASTRDATFVCISVDELGGEEMYRRLYAVLCLGAALLGFLGACWQIKQDWNALFSTNTDLDESQGLPGRGTSRPKTSVIIVFCLALANALACVGTVARGVGLLLTSAAAYDGTCGSYRKNETAVRATVTYDVIAASVSIDAFTKYMYTAGWLWTLAYAVYVCRQKHRSPRGIPFPAQPWTKRYMCLGWGLPFLCLLVVIPLTVYRFHDGKRCPDFKTLVAMYSMDYLPLTAVMVATPILLTKARRDARRIMLQQTATMTNAYRKILKAKGRTFVGMVIIFYICWLPNILDGIVQLSFFTRCNKGRAAIRFFWWTEAVVNPLQGLINCILYRGQLFGHVTSRGFWRHLCTCGRRSASDDNIQEMSRLLRSGDDFEERNYLFD